MDVELPEFDLDRYLPYRLTVAASKLSLELEKKYKTRFGLSIPEWRVLVNVGYSGSGSVRDIEKRVSLGKSKVSRTASRLEARGLLIKEEDPADRRLITLKLTQEGTRMLQEVVHLAKEFQDELFVRLGKDVDGLHQALDVLMTDQT
jgi:DNA-binding MarR family transcriptional regulator